MPTAPDWYRKSKRIVVQAYTPLVRGNDVAEGKGIKNEVVLKIAKSSKCTA